MEYTYGINVANRYVLLLDEPEEVPKILKEEEKDKDSKKTKTKKNLISEKENKGDGNLKEKGIQGGKKPNNENRNVKIIESGGNAQDSNRKGNNQRMQKGQHVKFASEVYEERNNARNFREKPPYQRSNFSRDNGNETSERDSGDDAPTEGSGNYTFRGGRGRGRGGRGGRGRGGGFGRVFSRGGRGAGGGGFRRYGADDSSQQQPYDNRDGNQSGDFYNQEKQQPAGNEDNETWDDGEEKEKPKPVAEEPLDWASDWASDTNTEPPKEQDDGGNQTQEPNSEEAEESSEPARTLLTLDEYKAMKGNREKPKYNLRRAGEGEDLSQWQNMHVLKNKLADVESEEEEEKYDPADYPQRVGRQKHILDINIQFKDAPRRGTRGRGRARGGRWAGSRGRGDGARFDNSEGETQDQESTYERADRFDRPGSFSQRAKQHTVTICNENEFPSLA